MVSARHFLVLLLASALVLAASVSHAAEVKRFDVPIGDSPTIGPADAPVTIIEFLDYQ